MGAQATLLERVAARLAEDPAHVAPVLRLIADPDAMPDRDEVSAAARRVNADRLTAEHKDFTTHALPGERVRAILGGITRQALHQRVRGRRLLALHLANNSWFPDWQFGPEGIRSGLADLLAELPDSPLAADRAVREPVPEEGGRSIADLLAAGDLAKALHYARTAGGDR